MCPEQIVFGVTVLVLSLVAHCRLKLLESSDFISKDCFPSLPCEGECLEDTFLDLEQGPCNQSSNSDTPVKLCQCGNTACYRVQKFCLQTCEDQSTPKLEACISCLSNLEKKIVKTMDIQSNDCTEQCKGMCLDLNCRSATTSSENEGCSSCAPGYKGESCDERCAPGCSGGACHAESGFCLDCPAGSYGPGCEFTCPSHCLDGNGCSPSGTCEACAVGYRGDDCREACPLGFYGDGCRSQCANTCKRGRCDHVDGHCLEGCKPGYFGLVCERSCPATMYGQDCLSNCPVTCAAGVPCHHETGACMSGCISGFRGTHCNITCPKSKYGIDCHFNCSKDCFHRLCNAFSGTCLTCEEAFYGSQCQFKINIDGIKQGALESEVSAQEAVLMIGGIGLLGILMWIAVAYLLLQQRKRILRDAAKGVDPRTSQWGMFPNYQGFRRAVRLYDKKWARLSGGDAKTSSKKRKRLKDKKTKPYAVDKGRRPISSAGKKLLWWTYPPAEKLIPPDEEDLQRVSKWLARYHGIEHPAKLDQVSKKSESEDEAETSSTESSSGSDNEGDTKTTGQNWLALRLKQETSTTQEQQEKTKLSRQSPICPDGTSLATFTGKTAVEYQNEQSEYQASHTDVEKSLHQGADNVTIRKDTIYLSPDPRPKGPSVSPEPKCLRETSRVNWIRNKHYKASGFTRPSTSTSKEQISSMSTSTTYSKSETTPSTSFTTSGESSTATNTNTSWQTKRGDSDYTTSEDTSDSSSSSESGDTSEGSSLSTLLTTHKDQNTLQEISSSLGNGHRAFARPEMKKAETYTASDEAEASGFFQKLAGVFRRTKQNKSEKKQQPEPGQATATTQSVPGAGGLPRPFSNKFLINRLETWDRNRGLEVNVHDGMMELASSKNQRTNQAHDMGAGPSGVVADGSSWASTDLSDTSRQSSRSTEAEPRTRTTTAITGDKYSKSNFTVSTSGEDLTDVPSTMITDTVKDVDDKPP